MKSLGDNSACTNWVFTNQVLLLLPIFLLFIAVCFDLDLELHRHGDTGREERKDLSGRQPSQEETVGQWSIQRITHVPLFILLIPFNSANISLN